MRLIAVTEGAFAAGLAQVRAGSRIGDISSAIQEYAESRGFGLAEGLTGHGIGVKMHEAPQVPNTGTAGTGMRLRPGMTLAIEPMVTAGSPETVLLDDGWTIVTADGQPAAHYEHTVLVTDDEPVLLTGSRVGVVQ
jgi:methionyl aminopeptidase